MYFGCEKGATMKITICNHQFDTENIIDLNITESSVLIDAKDDFYRLRYTQESEIIEARNYLKFKSLRKRDVMDAVMTIILICDYFINNKTQCELCPLKRNKGCIFESIPIDWRN